MTSEADRRRYQRLSTSGKPYEVQVKVHGRELPGVRLANLSACGCGLELQISEVADLEAGAILDEILIEHDDLPPVPLAGVIVRILGKVPGKTTGYVLVGVDFTVITPMVQTLINEHVMAQQAEV
ncbi:MAG TPA: PilZ domain-containing protein [Holophagaceae bacterium]